MEEATKSKKRARRRKTSSEKNNIENSSPDVCHRVLRNRNTAHSQSDHSEPDSKNKKRNRRQRKKKSSLKKTEQSLSCDVSPIKKEPECSASSSRSMEADMRQAKRNTYETSDTESDNINCNIQEKPQRNRQRKVCIILEHIQELVFSSRQNDRQAYDGFSKFTLLKWYD